MTMHTPGPWLYQEGADAYTHIVRASGNRFLCQLAQDTSGVAEANARLIAAAPELLAALEWALDRLLDAKNVCYGGVTIEEINERRVIIAKAIGGQS
jgi:hypothetical protein